MAKPLITQRTAAQPPRELFAAPQLDPAALADMLPEAQCRTAPPDLPALDETTLLAHFADLGTCAPPTDSPVAALVRAESLPALTRFHPRQPLETVQGLLEVAHEVARALAAMTGIDRFSLQPPTLAAAERAALRVAMALFARTQPHRVEAVVPEGSPAAATAADAGLTVRTTPRLASGDLDPDALMDTVGPNTAAVVASWLTPAGAFDRSLAAAGEVAHAHGALLCVDASGLAALVGRTRVRDAGADVVWLSLRELCPIASSAALGVRTQFTEFLPTPLVAKTRAGYELDDELPSTLGELALAPAHMADALAVYVQLRALGEPGLRARAERLVAEANARYDGPRPRLR